MHLETARLRIRDLTEDDAEFILRLVTDEAFIANIADKGIRDVDGARAFLRDGSWTNANRPGHGMFALELRDRAGTPIGIGGILYREALDVTDVGYALLPEHRGHGYAFEAAEAMVRYGHATLGMEQIVGMCAPANAASIRILEKLGMMFGRQVKMSDDDSGTLLYA